MTTTAVVEHFDVFEHISYRFLACAVALPMHSLVLQTVEEALGGRIVPAVTLAAHRAVHAVLTKLGLKRMTGVLTTAVRVMDQPRLRMPSEPRHGQCVDDNVSTHALLDRPADDLSIEQVQHDRQI